MKEKIFGGFVTYGDVRILFSRSIGITFGLQVLFSLMIGRGGAKGFFAIWAAGWIGFFGPPVFPLIGKGAI
jgi:hypothetical protein